MNYKRHKPQSNFPGRLITSGCGSYTENLSSLIALELKPRAESLPQILIDTNNLLRKIDNFNQCNTLPNVDIIHATWDVVAMFPNIPEDIGIAKCREMINKHPIPNGLPAECVIEGLLICLHYNISQFDNMWYRQVRGAAMGPHEACFYSDIAMSHFDELAFSDSNPHRKPLMWMRYRDDIYDPWPHGENELIKFTEWLNSLSDSIKFTLNYNIGQGIEYLDTFIYDKDGKLHTDVYSKASDTHAYLPPSSCHPYHICKNNPNQVARRVRKICSEDSTYLLARNKFSTLLNDRGYSAEAVSGAFSMFDSTPRSLLFGAGEQENRHTKSRRCFPLVSEFNPHLPAIPPVLNKFKYILSLDPVVDEAIPQNSIFASYTQPKNIKDILVHSNFSSSDIVSDTDLGCKPCGSCFLCKHYLLECDSFSSFECNNNFKIKQHITCNTEGIIYLLLDQSCNRSYVGSTIGNMRIRMSNYKSHIKTSHKGCEMAQHFAACPDVHPQFADGETNTRSKKCREKFDLHLGSQIKIVLIEYVDLTSCEPTADKRERIEVREGYWQTQLRTLSHYGGLNRKDERKISNKRIAKTTVSPKDHIPQPTDTPIPSSSQAPDPQSPPILRRSSRLHKKTGCGICKDN